MASSKWKSAPPGWAEKHNAARLADMSAGAKVWGNGCERRGCKAPSVQWIEVDGMIYEVCTEHAAEHAL